MRERIKQISRETLAVWAVPLAVVLFISITVIVPLRLGSARIDLTEEGKYTVSAPTRTLLESVEEPITLRLYLSSALITQLPEFRVYADRVVEMLRTYQRLSGGQVLVERVDPVPFSAAEDKAIGYSLIGLPLGRTGALGYFGLVGTNSVDQLEIIDVFSPAREGSLEYELSRAVMRLSNPTEPHIGFIDGLGLFGNIEERRRPSAIIDRLANDFALVPIDQDATALPDDLAALVVVHPHSMSRAALDAVDQYVMGGGPVLVFVDPLAERSLPDPNNPSRLLNPASDLVPLLAAWGIAYSPDAVVGDLGMALNIRAQAGNQVATTKYPPWLLVDHDNLADKDPVTSQLSLMRVSSAGSLEALGVGGLSFAPLIETTQTTMLFDRNTVLRHDDPRELVNTFVSSQTVRTLAARVSGQASSAFPEGSPDEAQLANGAVRLSASARPINVIVVADADMLVDDHNIGRDGQPTTQNADFVINALDSLIGGGDLYALRARSMSFRPFTLVNKIELAAQEKYLATEQQLQTELSRAQSGLAELRVSADGGEVATLTPEQSQMIADTNRRIVEIRNELREVQSALRRDVEALTERLHFFNVALIPGFIIMAGIGVTLWRRRRLTRHLRGWHTVQRG